MSKYYSTTAPVGTDNLNKEIEATFEMPRGTETVTINDELITNYEVAKDRAESIFLDQSYITQNMTIQTFHIDDVNLGDTAQVDGILYKVVGVSEEIKDAKVKMTITMKRWA